MAQTAVKAGHKVVFYSTELPGEHLTDRILTLECAWSTNRQEAVDEENMKQVYAIARNLLHVPLLIDDNARISIPYIRTSAIIWHGKGICDFIVVDSLQLWEAPTNSPSSRHKQETDQLLRQAKILAMELKLPILVISQLTKETQKSAEEYGDIVILLQYLPFGKTDGKMIITKNRNGPIEELPFSF